MSRLARLTPDGARLATPELASGQQPLWPADGLQGMVEPFHRDAPLERFDEALDALMKNVPAHSTALDAEAAMAVHRELSLTRREASDVHLFRWLAIVHRPDVVRHRWENTSWATMRTRFLAKGTRPDSNVFYRWWWMAELTRDGEDYGLTRRLLGRPHVATPVFVRTTSFYRPFLEAASVVLEDADSGVVERVLFETSRVLATVQLEAMSGAELRDELGRIRRRVQ